MWSASHPPIGDTKMAGSVENAATSPANAGDPVRSRISQGIVIARMELPSPDEKFEIW
jgi:hypothetical protein